MLPAPLLAKMAQPRNLEHDLADRGGRDGIHGPHCRRSGTEGAIVDSTAAAQLAMGADGAAHRHTPITRRAACRALALAACAGHLRAQADDAPAPVRRWPADRATPPLTLRVWGGGTWSLAAARGKVVLLNFWASWCEPCRDEMPSLELLEQRFERDGLMVAAINFRETDAAIRRFLDVMPTSLTVLRDADGAAAHAFGARVFPTTVVIGRDGRAQFSRIGEVDWTGPAARSWLAPSLAAPAR